MLNRKVKLLCNELIVHLIIRDGKAQAFEGQNAHHLYGDEGRLGGQEGYQKDSLR
jgi:hypothetical protein